jgi:hypothetical protein
MRGIHVDCDIFVLYEMSFPDSVPFFAEMRHGPHRHAMSSMSAVDDNRTIATY